MAIVRQKGDILYIQWYDPLTKKTQSKSTGLIANPKNRREAKKIAAMFQEELTRKTEEMKAIGIQRVSIKDAFEHLLRNNQNKHPKTIKDYMRFYKKFTEYFDENLPCASLTKIGVEEWLNEIKKLPFAQNTIHGYGKRLNHFMNFLFEYNYTPMFKINKEVKTKPEIKEKIILSDPHISLIFENLDRKNSNFMTVINLLFYTGLRPTDLLTITCDRVEIDKRIIRYYSPKRKKYREVAFHKDLVKILSERIEEVGEGKIIDYKTAEQMGAAINRFMKQIGLNGQGYSARTFRKTFITLCRSRYNMDASIVRELVGHEHGNTTDRYYNRIGTKQMRKELKKFKRPQ
jgi:integrase